MNTRIYLAVCLFLCGWTGGRPEHACGQNLASGETMPTQWSDDATLRDVVFTSETSGIAVGDLGTVLRTVDGGRTWKPIFISNDCSLQSISFSDPTRGWIAGGYCLPIVGHHRGVLLQTTNGGDSWSELNSTSLPAIEQVEFVNDRLGWARVCRSEFHPSGLCSTQDVAQSWSEMAPDTPWEAGVVARGDEGLIASHGGRLGRVLEQSFRLSQQPAIEDQAFRAIAMCDGQRGYALGEQSLLATSDGGQSWERVELPAEIFNSPYRTWHTLAARGDQIWLAGSPGTQIVRVDLQAKTIHPTPTPVRTTLRRLFFLNESLGWAVGDLGTILTTRDGGASWTVQRSASPRLAVLFVARTAAELPYELMARLCGDQGHLGGVLLFDADQHATASDYHLRVRQAIGRVGVTLIEPSTATDQAQAEREIERLVRQTQPSTVVIAQAPEWGVRGGIDVPSAAASAVGAATVHRADSPWLVETALPYWQTPKVLLTLTKIERDSPWGAAELLPKLSRNVSDYALPSRGLAGCLTAGAVRLETTYLNGMNLDRGSDFFDGSQTGPLAPPQREPLKPQGYLSQIKAISTKAQILQPLLDSFDDDPQSISVWHPKLDALCSELPRDVAGIWLWQLSEAYWQANKPRLAALARQKLLENCPQHALALESHVWLVHYFASGEIAQLEFRRQRDSLARQPLAIDPPVAGAGIRTVIREIELDGVKRMVWVPEKSEDSASDGQPEARQVSGTVAGTATYSEFYRERLETARQLLNRLSASSGSLTAQPRLTWVELALARRLDGPVAFETRAARIDRDRWGPAELEVLRRESALTANRELDPTVPVAVCPVVIERPYLDGVLDDVAWRTLAQQDKILRLKPIGQETSASPAATPPGEAVRAAGDPALGQTQVLIARDSEFLYLAIQCHFVELTAWNDQPERDRDVQLSPQDRCEIRFDVDRDGTSRAVFGFDHAGNFSDGIERDSGWNPEWYFAQSRSFNTWTIEAAIPLAALQNADEELRDDVWGLSIERHLPRGVRERWQPAPHLAAASRTPEQFEFTLPDGYLKIR